MEHPTPHLTQLAAFKEALSDYHVSESSRTILKQTELVLIVAPSAVGKNTIINELVKTSRYYFIVSDTTRPPKLRDGRMEQNGREYFFRSEDEVLEDIKSGNFLEAAIIHDQQVSGISIRELASASNQDKIAITDVEIIGAGHVVTAKPDTNCFFILPPSFEEWQRRLMHRGHMSQDELQRRMQNTLEEIQASLEEPYYKYVLNDTIDNAVVVINQAARYGVIDESYQADCRSLAMQLYAQTKAYLDLQAS